MVKDDCKHYEPIVEESLRFAPELMQEVCHKLGVTDGDINCQDCKHYEWYVGNSDNPLLKGEE